MIENEKVSPVEEATNVVETEPVEVSKVDNSSQAEEEATKENAEEDKTDSEDQKETEEDSSNEDADKKEDDEEPITNMGHLRKVQKESIRVKAENKTLKEENEQLKKTLEDSPIPEAATKKIAELEAKIQEYTDKENESSKREALKEAGLPENYLAILKGSEEEWKATLEILKEDKTTTKKRLADDSYTNSLSGKYKKASVSLDDVHEAVKNLHR